jgi:hypothetical protein
MVLEIEGDPAAAEILLSEVEVLAVDTEGDVPQAAAAPVVATRPEQRQPAPYPRVGSRDDDP